MSKIPKIIHYCWFGGNEKPPLVLKCIESWRKYMPEYELIEWNEHNFISDNNYMQEALNEKKYAFASDYARLKIIYDFGGVYLDTDVELLKPLHILLENKGFIGFEKKSQINTGLGFAAEKHNMAVKLMLDEYENLNFIVNGKLDLTPCPIRNTKALKKLGLILNNELQDLNHIMVYPTSYFCPIDYDSGNIYITNNTFSIHHYGYSWADSESLKLLKVKRKIFKYVHKPYAQLVFNIYNKIYRFFRMVKK